MTVTTSIFGHTKRGQTVTAYRLENRAGMQVTVLDYGRHDSIPPGSGPPRRAYGCCPGL